MADIKDSGARRSFGTGAVRDMSEGKGRNDLLHPIVMQKIIGNLSEFAKYTIDSLDDKELYVQCKMALYTYYAFPLSTSACDSLCCSYLLGCTLLCRTQKEFAYSDKNHMEMYVIGTILLSRHYEKGAKKYGDHNWSKGIPSVSFYDSAHRHVDKWFLGWEDEPHLEALLFNIVGLLYNNLYRKDLEIRIYAGGKRLTDEQLEEYQKQHPLEATPVAPPVAKTE